MWAICHTMSQGSVTGGVYMLVRSGFWGVEVCRVMKEWCTQLFFSFIININYIIKVLLTGKQSTSLIYTNEYTTQEANYSWLHSSWGYLSHLKSHTNAIIQGGECGPSLWARGNMGWLPWSYQEGEVCSPDNGRDSTDDVWGKPCSGQST